MKNNSVVPTLKSAVAGDITFALGYRTMTDILQFIRTLDKVVEGFANPDNLLYAPEIKFYSNKVIINEVYYNLFIIYNAKPTIFVALNNLPKIYLFEADSVNV